jgi:uncharacterized phage-associated protein
MSISARDVAEYVLDRQGAMTAMKLQKLLYYSQAWHAVWEEEELFPDRIEAWASGPVVPSIYALHRGEFRVQSGAFGGDAGALSEAQRESIDAVLMAYGDRNPQWLSDLTHIERPWCDARAGLAEGERGNRVISLASMAEYYSSIPPVVPE